MVRRAKTRVALDGLRRSPGHLFLYPALLQFVDHRYQAWHRARVFPYRVCITISLVCDALHKALRRVELSEAKAVQHARDIERRDQAVRDAQQQLHLITDSMSALVTRCTPDLKYSWVSKPYADWLRRSRDEIIGASIESIIGPAAFQVLLPNYRRVLEPWGTTATIVAITGWGQAEDEDLSREAGFDHHLVKPVDPDTLLNLIQTRKAAHA